MREILFRGKSLDYDEWVEGSLVVTTIQPADDAPIKHYHIEDMTIGVFPNEFQSGLSATVDPATVGQFTGLIDKNDKKIFEGDLIRHYNQSNHPEAYDLYRIEFDVRGCMWVGRYNDNYAAQLRNYLGERYEVVGNIHDNPELLELSKRRTDNA